MNQRIADEIKTFILSRAHNGAKDTTPEIIFREFGKRYPGVDVIDEAIVGYEAAGEWLQAEAEELGQYRRQRFAKDS